jgi:hypothetical protein
MKLHIIKSNKKFKKFDAVFEDDEGIYKIISFGDNRYQDFTQTGNPERRYLYLLRHHKNENWNTPFTASSLSRWILWGDSKNIYKNITSFKKMFNLK